MNPKDDIIALLIKENFVTPQQVEQAREETKKTGLTLERALEKMGFLTEEDIARIKASALGLAYMDLSDYIIDPAVIKIVPEAISRKFKAVPLFQIGNSITIGMVNPQDILAIDYIRRVSKMDMVEPVLVSEKGIQRILESSYGSVSSIEAIVKDMETKKADDIIGKTSAQIAEDAPVIKLVNVMITQAFRDRVSDIHVEPEEEMVRVRSRIDGILHEVAILPKKLQTAVISRIKIMGKMDIAENRKPQDGRIRMRLENKDLDMRVSTFPTIHGENVVMRILDKSSVVFGLKELGLMDKDMEDFNKAIRRPNGIILVTGPTGSGKTSTLYAALTTISTIEKNIITIEDPVEYELPLIRQTQINVKAGITFAEGLRSILRQDPDIVMVGEIRDKETADVAIQAALTGHLVFSTLHTNDAPSSLTRLIDMGVEPFLISSSVIAIIAQRLVRLICTKCKKAYQPPPEVLQELGMEKGTEFFRGQGCIKCRETGFMGRMGIFEILILNEEIRRMVDARITADDIKRKAKELGMRTLREDGLQKVRSGQTTPEEVLRVTSAEK